LAELSSQSRDLRERSGPGCLDIEALGIDWLETTPDVQVDYPVLEHFASVLDDTLRHRLIDVTYVAQQKIIIGGG